MKKTSSLRGSLILLLTATIWGVAFVAQSVGMDYVGGFTFTCVRFLIGAVVLTPVIMVMDRYKTPEEKAALRTPEARRTLLTGGICCGIFLCSASLFQQFGIKYTTVGKAGFITACYIILVPIMGLFLHKKCGPAVWAAVVLALIGLYLLCMKGDSFSLGKGEVLLIICAFLFSFQILSVDHFSPLTDGVRLSRLQFLVVGVLSGILMLIFEKPTLSQLTAAWAPILYAGVLSSGVAYTLQIIGQRDLNPAIASLIMSLEAAISVLAGWLLLGQVLTPREIIGCVIMFAAILLAQAPVPDRSKSLSRDD